MKVYQHLAALLAADGIDTMFGLMGDANMYVSSVFEQSGGRFVRVAHEAGAVSMADGYARMSGRPGVASVTHGPGFTNTLTALVEAARFPSPVLLITGDPPPEATHFQRLDIAAVCASVGVTHERIHRPDSVARDYSRAMRKLRTSGGPVVLNLPLNLAVLDSASVKPGSAPTVLHTAASTTDGALDDALGLAAFAARPIIVAGRGATSATAEAALLDLADVLGAALFTTGLGLGLFRDHPRHLGIMGSLAHEEAGQILADSDCVLAFGASLNRYTALGGELTHGKRLLQVDTDPVKLGWYVTPDEGVVGDAATVAAAMAAELRTAELPENTSWRARSAAAAAAMTTWTPADDRTGSDTVDIRIFSQRLNEILPENCTMVSDVGRFIAGSWPYLNRFPPGRFTAMTGFCSIGLGIAGGTGAAVAQPRDPTIVLVGDGGFMMHASELSTAVREGLPLLVVVFNDGAYGAEYHKLIAQELDASHSYNQWPEISRIAAATGADTHVVRVLDDIELLAKQIAHLDAPLVVDVHIDPTHQLPF